MSATEYPRRIASDNVVRLTDREVQIKPIGRDGYCFITTEDFRRLVTWIRDTDPGKLPRWARP